MRRRDRAMTLIGAKVSKLRAQRPAPHDSMAAISGMPEVECAPHFGDVATNETGAAAKTAASEDQCIAADPLATAVGVHHFDSQNSAIRIGDQPLCRAVREDHNLVQFSGVAQTVDQFTAGTAWQAMHAHGGMPRIVEVIDHLKRQAVSFRQPFDQRGRADGDSIHERAISFAPRLARDIGGKHLRGVRNTPGALKFCAGGRNEAGRQRR